MIIGLEEHERLAIIQEGWLIRTFLGTVQGRFLPFVAVFIIRALHTTIQYRQTYVTQPAESIRC